MAATAASIHPTATAGAARARMEGVARGDGIPQVAAPPVAGARWRAHPEAVARPGTADPARRREAGEAPAGRAEAGPTAAVGGRARRSRRPAGGRADPTAGPAARAMEGPPARST